MKNFLLFILFFIFTNLYGEDLIISGRGEWQRPDQDAIVEELNGVDLEHTHKFDFALGGQTSLNLNAENKDKDLKVNFVTRNAAANPGIEIAYYTLGRILGVEELFRAAVPYSLGPKACAKFDELIAHETFEGMREGNAQTIRAELKANPNELKGCLKEKKRGKTVLVDEFGTEDVVNAYHPVIRDIQMNNPQPSDDAKTHMRGVTENDHHEEVEIEVWAPRASLARQYSILMTFDAIFGQWDRYSGSNVSFRIKKHTTNNEVELYSTDNGGADFWWDTTWTLKQASWFSRYDKQVIADLRKIYTFLSARSGTTRLRSERLKKTWTTPENFVVDLGLYYEMAPADYVTNLKNNIGAFLAVVQRNVSEGGNAKAYFQ